VAAGQRTPGPLVVFSKTLPTGALPALSHSGRSMPTPRAIVASAVLVIVGTAFPGLLVGGLAPEIQADLALSRPALGLAVAVFWLAAAVASAPAGRFVDRFGPLRGIHVAGVLAALGALGVAAASSTSFLIASLAVGGSANAFSTPGVSALASRAIPTERQGLAFGVQLAGPAIAALLAGLALPLLAGPVGWRTTFAAAAILALATAATVPRVTTPRPQMDSRSDDRRLRPLLMLRSARPQRTRQRVRSSPSLSSTASRSASPAAAPARSSPPQAGPRSPCGWPSACSPIAVRMPSSGGSSRCSASAPPDMRWSRPPCRR
jgi:MFS family permease